MSFPPAYQEPTPFGANIGGTNPQFWAYSPSAQFDSWLAVGDFDGKDTTAVSSIGIDFDSWDETTGLSIDNGAVFWMDPNRAPDKETCVIAQLTIADGTDWSATVNARGKTGDFSGGGGDDWEVTLLHFGADLVDNTPAGHRRRLGSNEGWAASDRVVPERAGNTDYNNWNSICDFSMDTNGDGKVGKGDDAFATKNFFGAVLSKDAVFYLATDQTVAPLLKYIECDEPVGNR